MSYWKQTKIEHLADGRVSLNAWYSNGHPAKYNVSVKRDGKKRKTFFFLLAAEAQRLYDRLVANLEDTPQSSQDSVDSRLSDAAIILADPSTNNPALRTLNLAIAMEQVTTSTVNKHRNPTAELLAAENILPPPEEFPAWVSRCLHILRNTPSKRKKIVTLATFKQRLMILSGALKQIAMFPEFWGTNVAAAAQACRVKVSAARRNMAKGTVAVEHHQPLSCAEIKTTLQQLPTLQDQLWFLKSLACGLRPSEVLRLQQDHVQNGKVILSKVISKTRTKKTPPAATALQLILRLQSLLPPPTIKLSQTDIQAYQCRTTLATHLIYCGVDFNSVAEFLGHATSDMALRVYSTQRPPEATDSPAAYYGVKGVRVEGQTVAALEPLYHQWLLALCLGVLKSTEHWSETKRILLAGNKPDVAVGEVADF